MPWLSRSAISRRRSLRPASLQQGPPLRGRRKPAGHRRIREYPRRATGRLLAASSPDDAPPGQFRTATGFSSAFLAFPASLVCFGSRNSHAHLSPRVQIEFAGVHRDQAEREWRGGRPNPPPPPASPPPPPRQ